VRLRIGCSINSKAIINISSLYAGSFGSRSNEKKNPKHLDVGLGRAQPETRKARWPVSPRAGIILGPTRTLFFSGHEPTNFGKKRTFFEEMWIVNML
jgi:hypothetical protein